jgi:hypothetical protein
MVFMNNSMKLSKLEKCGTVRALFGFGLIVVGIAVPFWVLAVIGFGLVIWALRDVARLEGGA